MAGGGTGTGCCTGSIDFRLAPDTRRGDGACATGERVGVGTRGEATCAATGGTTAAFSGAGVCCSRGDCLRGLSLHLRKIRSIPVAMKQGEVYGVQQLIAVDDLDWL